MTCGIGAVTAIAGTVVMGLLIRLFGEITFNAGVPDLGDLLLPIVGMGVGAAAGAVGTIRLGRNSAES